MDPNTTFLDWLHRHRLYAFEILRIYLGLGLFTKGVILLLREDQAAYFQQFVSIPAWPFLFVHYAIVVLIIGGLFMAMGLLTRVVAILQMPVMIGGTFYIYLQHGLFSLDHSFEFVSLTFVLLVVFAVYGSGSLSIDEKLRKNKASSI